MNITPLKSWIFPFYFPPKKTTQQITNIYIYVYVYIYVFIYISSSVLLFFFLGGYSYTIYYIFLIRCARISVKSKRPSVFLEGEDEGAFLRTGPQFGLLIWLDPRPKKAGTSWKVMGKSWKNHDCSEHFGDLMILYSYGDGSIPINTIFSGMNIHLPAILMFTRGTRF